MPRKAKSQDVKVRYLGPVCQLQLADGPRIVATGAVVDLKKSSKQLARLQRRGLAVVLDSDLFSEDKETSK